MRFAVRAAIALVVLLVLAGGAYAAYWFAAASTMRGAVTAWAAAPGDGTTVRIADIAISGFPTQLVADIPRIEVQRSDALGLTYIGENVRVMRPLRGGDVVVSVRGPQTVSYRDGTETRTLRAKADLASLELRSGDDGAFSGFNLILGNLTVERPDLAPLTARRIQVQMGKGSGLGNFIPERSRFTVRIENMVMPEHRRGPLGDTIEQFATNAALTKGIDSANLPVSLAAWRDTGGYLTLVETVLKWGSLDLQGQGSGVLKLDDQMRPAGGLNVQLRDYLLTVDAFHAARRLSDEARAAVQQLVGFLSTRGADGRVGLPLEIVNGEIIVGPAKLGTVSPILPGPATAP